MRLIESGLLQRITSSSSVPRPLSVPSELTAAGRAVRKMTQLKGREGEYCFFGIPQFNIDSQNMKIGSGFKQKDNNFFIITQQELN